jgi:hypothetical protein
VGETLTVQLGESLAGEHQLQFPMFTGNVYESIFTLGGSSGSGADGADANGNVTMHFEHHEYSEFRFGTLRFTNASVAAKVALNLRAWVVRYPWVETDHWFSSSDPVLNSVYALCNYTLKA